MAEVWVGTFRQELREHKGERITVFWHCGQAGTGASPYLPVLAGIAETTGKLLEVGSDYVKVQGIVPLFEDFTGLVGRCVGPGAGTFPVVIPLHNVCAVVLDMLEENKAGYPVACTAVDPPSAQSEGGTPS
jgi:hypothetical protein